MTSYYPEKRKYNRTVSVLRIKFLLILFLFIPAGVFFSSCEEKTTIIGIGLLPPGDFTSTTSTDTISVFSYTYTIDSVATSKSTTYSYLGGLYDPYFGTSTTGFVGQLRILKEFTEKNEFFVDSVKLLMSIGGAKGVVGTRQKIIIYEIDELLDPDSYYYSDRDPHATNLMADTIMPVVKKDSAQNLFIRLPDSFGRYLMRDTSKLYQDSLENDFRSFFKGIYCQMVPYTGTKGSAKRYTKGFTGGFSKGPETDSLQLIALTFAQSEFLIRVYYKTAVSTSALWYDFTINPNSARYNLYSHDFTTAEPGKEISHVDDNVKDSLSYQQGFNGVYTKIRIPALDSLKKLMPISVNKAKLTISVFLDEDIYTTATVPTNIYMSYMAADTVKRIVPDYNVNPAFFDGTFSSTTKKYTFNLASFTQMYLEGKIPLPELDLYFQEGEYKNVILKANQSAAKPKFEFTFTRF